MGSDARARAVEQLVQIAHDDLVGEVELFDRRADLLTRRARAGRRAHVERLETHRLRPRVEEAEHEVLVRVGTGLKPEHRALAVHQAHAAERGRRDELAQLRHAVTEIELHVRALILARGGPARGGRELEHLLRETARGVESAAHLRDQREAVVVGERAQRVLGRRGAVARELIRLRDAGGERVERLLERQRTRGGGFGSGPAALETLDHRLPLGDGPARGAGGVLPAAKCDGGTTPEVPSPMGWLRGAKLQEFSPFCLAKGVASPCSDERYRSTPWAGKLSARRGPGKLLASWPGVVAGSSAMIRSNTEDGTIHGPGDILAVFRSQLKAPRRRLRIAGLFSGIGGLELGLQRAGHVVSMHCEIDTGAVAVLETRFPGVPIHRDVRTLSRLPKGTDLLVGGFPCQDLSQAGKTRGIEGKNSGLVDEVFRLIEREQVPLVLLENVPFMLRLARGKAMDHIVSAFERLGYKWAYRVVDTRAFGLPQRRQRVLFLASKSLDPRRVLMSDEAGEPPVRPSRPTRHACGFYWTEGSRGLGWAEDAVPTLKGGSTIGIPSPPAIWMPDGRIVRPDIRDAERMQGFEPNWTEPASSACRASHRWKLVGNAVTVDVAHWVGLRLRSPGQATFNGLKLDAGTPWPDSAWNVGSGRYFGSLSHWPFRTDGVALARFLKYPPEPLSVKATSGFLSRFKKSTLRKPPGFVEALEAHVDRLSRVE